MGLPEYMGKQLRQLFHARDMYHALISTVVQLNRRWVRVWISNYFPLFHADIITYSCLNLNADLVYLC